MQFPYSRPARPKIHIYNLVANHQRQRIRAFHHRSESDPEGGLLTLIRLDKRVLQSWAAKKSFRYGIFQHTGPDYQ